MVTFVIFWAALLAIIFFVLGIVFKGLASAFNALMSSVGAIIGFAALALLIGGALYSLYAIVDGIITKGLGEVIGMIFLFLFELGLVGALVGPLGSLLINAATVIVQLFLVATSFVLEGAAAICQKGYDKFLTVIFKRLDKC